MKHLILIILGIFILLTPACKSVNIDYYSASKGPSSTDVLFLKNIEINSHYSSVNLAHGINRVLIFALQKKQYKIKSYIESPGIADNHRYHVYIKSFINRIGDSLDQEDSIILFFIIKDTKTAKEIINIRVACNGCDLQNVKDQIDLFDKIVDKFDTLIKR